MRKLIQDKTYSMIKELEEIYTSDEKPTKKEYEGTADMAKKSAKE